MCMCVCVCVCVCVCADTGVNARTQKEVLARGVRTKEEPRRRARKCAGVSTRCETLQLNHFERIDNHLRCAHLWKIAVGFDAALLVVLPSFFLARA
jgi:uncharacterized MAPEG superfamily protein